MIDKADAALRMRELPNDERDQLIVAGGDKVVDLRSQFERGRKQRAIAEGYRRPPVDRR